jgi:hypothetical protein
MGGQMGDSGKSGFEFFATYNSRIEGVGIAAV